VHDPVAAGAIQSDADAREDENVLFQTCAPFERASIRPSCPWTIVVWSISAASESAR
jgi:hypothetical protein